MTPSISKTPAFGGRESHVLLAFVAAAFLFAYAPVIQILRQQWASNDTYSFGILVPFISAYLTWAKRDELALLPVKPALWVGGLLTTFSGAMLLLGRATAIVAVQELSLIAMLGSLIVLLLGWQFLRALLFPVTYLVIMLPLWEVVTNPLHHPSQVFSAKLSEAMLAAIGVPVYRQDLFLHLPSITLEVASACSGINFLIAVLAIGVPQAYLRLRGWWPRFAVLAFAMAVALSSNGLRIAVIGWLSYHRLSETVHGPGHVLQGLFVSSFGIVAVLASVEILARWHGALDVVSQPAVQKRSRLGGAARWPLLAASTLAVAALSVTVTGSSAIIAGGEVREPQPLQLDMRWSPRAIATTPRYLSTGGSAAVVVSARSEDGEPFEVVVSNLADRDPEGGVRYRAVDLPAGVSATQVSLTMPGGTTHSVNRAVINHAASKTELVYWYDLNGRTTAQGPLAKAFAAANAFGLTARGPLLVLVLTERVEPGSSAALAQLVAEVARALRPELR